jgi:hypothetical protein
MADRIAAAFQEQAKRGITTFSVDMTDLTPPLCYRNVDPSLPCVCGARTRCPVILPSAINGYQHRIPIYRSIKECLSCSGDLVDFEYDEDLGYPPEWEDVTADAFCINCRDVFVINDKERVRLLCEEYPDEEEEDEEDEIVEEPPRKKQRVFDE